MTIRRLKTGGGIANNILMGYRTPNIDRIAKEGMMFTDSYGEQSCTAGRSSFITGQSVPHFVWTPKYRRKVIVGNVEKRLKSLLKEKCKQLNIDISFLEMMPDQIHVFVSSIFPNRIIGALKGYISRVLRQEFVELRSKLPTL